MANRPTTIAEKKLAGSYRPGTHGTEDPPQGVKGRPPIPAALMANPHALQIFVETCDMMEEADWLRVSDGPTLHAYAILKARLDTDPDTFSAAEFTQFRLYCNELGLSPAARAKMPKRQGGEQKPENPFSDL